MVIVGIIGLPVSVIFVVIVLGKSYATQNSDPIFCTIMVLGPVMLLLAALLCGAAARRGACVSHESHGAGCD